MVKLRTFSLLLGLLLVAPAFGEEQPISSGDRLNIMVTGESELSKAYTVDQDGVIVVPLVGKVSVKGLSPAQVREDLAKRLAKFVRNPEINVEFEDRAQITVGFTGAVTKPGPVTLKKGSRLLDALAEVEGLALDADAQKVTLQVRSGSKARELDLRKLLNGDVSLNVELQDGDAIYVPRIALNAVRVLGAVKKPGEFKKQETVPLLEAILSAGGLTPDADRQKVQVVRKGAEKPELFSLDDVLTGKSGNVVLKDGDVVTVQAIPKITVRVFGRVAKPGVTEMKTGTTVLEALTAAGGFAMDADKNAVMLTTATGEVKRLQLEKVDSPDGALPLDPECRLFVPQAAMLRFAVAGGVNTPGLFPMPTDPQQKIYLTDALAQAGGLAERAKKKNITVVRKNPNGGQPMLQQVDLAKLLDPKKRDPAANMEILANDVVIVDQEPEEGRSRRLRPAEILLGVASAFFGF